MTIEQEASDEFKRRASEGIMFPSPSNAFAQGYIAGANRAPQPVTDEPLWVRARRREADEWIETTWYNLRHLLDRGYVVELQSEAAREAGR